MPIVVGKGANTTFHHGSGHLVEAARYHRGDAIDRSGVPALG